MRPIALTIAGSDSSGGAGVQADLKAFGAFGVYGASVITALTAQNTRGVAAVEAVSSGFVGQQLASVLDDLDVRAIKTGMLARADIVEVVAAALAARPGVPVVVDPVMVATSGDMLLEANAVAALRDRLMPLSSLITPNLAEAAVLSAMPVASGRDEMVTQGRALVELGAPAVLVKGGHCADASPGSYASPVTGGGAVARAASDCLVTRDGVTWFSQPWVVTDNTHGTGCTLSAAIAAGLASGWALNDAIARAKAYLTAALEAGRDLGVGTGPGSGHGPPDHLVDPQVWRRW